MPTLSSEQQFPTSREDDLKNDETRKLPFFECCENDVDDGDDAHGTERLLPSARSKLWFKWSGADLIQCSFPAGYAKSLLNDDSVSIIQEEMRFHLDVTEHEIDKDLSRTFSDSELRERYKVRLVEPYRSSNLDCRQVFLSSKA